MPNYYEPEIECASRETLREIQSQRLVEMVKRCYDHVPLYKKRFDEMGLKPEDIRSIDDLTKLPFTTKQDLRDTYPFGLIAVPRDDLARVHASSGTTGKQTVVAYTQNDLDIWARSAARAIVGCGGTHEDFVHVSYGYGLFTGGLGLHDGAEKMGATVIPVSSGNTSRQVQILQDYGSDILACTPSYAMYIGEKIDLHIKDLNNALDCAHTVGSPLPMTAAVQEIFQWLHNNGCGQDDHSSIIKYYKKLTGIESL